MTLRSLSLSSPEVHISSVGIRWDCLYPPVVYFVLKTHTRIPSEISVSHSCWWTDETNNSSQKVLFTSLFFPNILLVKSGHLLLWHSIQTARITVSTNVMIYWGKIDFYCNNQCNCCYLQHSEKHTETEQTHFISQNPHNVVITQKSINAHSCGEVSDTG